jgi:hypothetical protein
VEDGALRMTAGERGACVAKRSDNWCRRLSAEARFLWTLFFAQFREAMRVARDDRLRQFELRSDAILVIFAAVTIAFGLSVLLMLIGRS